MNCKHGIWLAGWLFPLACLGQNTEENWRSGRELQQALSAPVNLQSSQESPRDFFRRLGQSQQIALFLDRRIDPSSARDFNPPPRSLLSIMTLAADRSGATPVQFGDLIYVAPADVGAVLPDALQKLRNQVKGLPGEARKRWQRSQPLVVPRLTKPSDLLRELAVANNISLEGLEKIPHDLWPEIRTPSLTLTERISLVLFGFGLWPELSADGESVRLIEFPVPIELTRMYSTKKSKELVHWARQYAPHANLVAKSGSCTVTGSPLDHHQIALWIAENEAVDDAAPAGSQKVVSLHATASAGAIARQVADQLKLEFVCDPAAMERLEKRVEINVDRVSYHELMKQVLADTGLSFQLDQRQLRIFPQ